MSSVDLDIECSMNYERSASAPSSPNERSSVLRDIASLGGVGSSRRVTFPDDDTIVTGYFEAPDPWGEEVSTDNIVAAYRAACWKQGVKPLQRVLQQLQAVTLNAELEFELNLKGENLDAAHCEALEEIFKRLQFRSLLLEDSNLNDEGAAAIFDMIEYYDTTSHLNISANKSIGNQGWQACSKMLKKTPCLQYLDASYTAQNEQSLLILGRAFRTGSYLATLHLEHCAITGRSLVILVAALKLNTTLLELFLGDNKICSADGLQFGNLLRSNSTLQLLDLRTNNLQDLGVCHLVDGLCQQAANCGECLRTLNLSNNNLTKNGMTHINRALLVSESLASLDLGGNCVCDEGIQGLKQGLLTNQSLEELSLLNTKITCEGAVALAEFIADNQHIASLDLRGNDIQVAGLMALSLSLKHNASLVCLKVDTPTQPCSEGMSSEQSLQAEIAAYCGRNRQKIEQSEKVDFVAQGANIPVIRSEAELAALIQEKATHRNKENSISSSSSFPGNSSPKCSTSSSSNTPRNRFQVCRVFLDADSASLEEDSPNSDDGPAPHDSAFLPTANESAVAVETHKPYIRHQDSLALHKHKQRRHGNSDDEADDVGEMEPPSQSHRGNKKKLSFVLPDDYVEGVFSPKCNRRMSTPAVASQRLVQQKQNVLKMKLGRQLEGLDLRSSVPLSPTRLREGLVFPDPIESKTPTVASSS